MKTIGMFLAAGIAASASAQFGAINDMYAFGDSSDAVYEAQLNGTFVGTFSNTGRGNTHGVFGGPSNTFLAGGFSGIKEIDGLTGAVLRTIGNAGDNYYGVQYANNGNILASHTYGSGSSSIDEYSYLTGNYVQTIVANVGGWAAFTVRQNRMYVVDDRTNWFDGTIISERDSSNGNLLQSWNLNGYSSIQAVRFDSFGNLYFASMYNSVNGIFRLDITNGNVTLFADNNVPGGGPTGWPGCHGFNFGPDGNLYCAMAGGTVAKYNGVTGAFIGIVLSVNDKLSDVVFKPVPTPGTLGGLALVGLVASRRRRA